MRGKRQRSRNSVSGVPASRWREVGYRLAVPEMRWLDAPRKTCMAVLATTPRFIGSWMSMTGFILVWLLFLGTALAQSPSDVGPPTRWQRSAQQKMDLTRDVTWLSHEPLAFLLRRGDHFDDEADRYERMCDSDNLKRMAGAGVRYGRLFFYKGFGLEYERPNIETAKRTAAAMHQLGMKVSLYMAGTMFTETLYHEIPEARSWEQRDQNGCWVPYGIQTYRHYACPNKRLIGSI